MSRTASFKCLLQLKDEAEIVIVVSAEDIEKSKVRGDLGITYDVDALRLAKAFTKKGLMVGGVVLTKYAAHPKVLRFEERLADAGIPVYHHYLIDGYPSNISNIVSDNGYGKTILSAPKGGLWLSRHPPRRRKNGGLPFAALS